MCLTDTLSRRVTARADQVPLDRYCAHCLSLVSAHHLTRFFCFVHSDPTSVQCAGVRRIRNSWQHWAHEVSDSRFCARLCSSHCLAQRGLHRRHQLVFQRWVSLQTKCRFDFTTRLYEAHAHEYTTCVYIVPAATVVEIVLGHSMCCCCLFGLYTSSVPCVPCYTLLYSTLLVHFGWY